MCMADAPDDLADGVVVEPDAAVARRGAEPIGQAGAAAPVKRDQAVAAVEMLEHLAMGGQGQDPRALEAAGGRAVAVLDGEKAAGRGGRRLADHHAPACDRASGVAQYDLAAG